MRCIAAGEPESVAVHADMIAIGTTSFVSIQMHSYATGALLRSDFMRALCNLLKVYNCTSFACARTTGARESLPRRPDHPGWRVHVACVEHLWKHPSFKCVHAHTHAQIVEFHSLPFRASSAVALLFCNLHGLCPPLLLPHTYTKMPARVTWARSHASHCSAKTLRCLRLRPSFLRASVLC